MRIRAVDANGDRVFGRDQASILRDTPDAVALLVEARLNLWMGQWYLDPSEGLPVEQQILGMRTEAYRDAVIKERILETPGVIEIVAYSSEYDAQARTFTVSATISTAYSVANLAGPEATQASLTVKVEDGR